MLSQGLFRAARSRIYHNRPYQPIRRPSGPARHSFPTPIQRRDYRPINYRHFLISWNTLREWVRTPLFYYNVAGIWLLCGLFYAHYLERVPMTGRLRFNVISQHWEEQLAKKLLQEYQEKYENKLLPPDSNEHRVARRVFDRMVTHSGLSDTEWDIIVYDDSDHMAFVLPGGKVFISSGMVNFCKSDDELASVFGHEMAHNVCHHGAESTTRNILRFPAIVISWLATGMDPDLVEVAVDVAFRLPGSRLQEREADYLGLLIMAESGYDASAAMELWSRWEEFDTEQRPSYLSTHPSHHSRTLDTFSWLKAAGTERLSGSLDHEFRANYYLQRTFCGLSRTPFDVATGR